MGGRDRFRKNLTPVGSFSVYVFPREPHRRLYVTLQCRSRLLTATRTSRSSRMEREEGEWIVYEGDVSLDEFFKTNRPSLIEISLHPWIAVYCPQRPPQKTLDEDALLGEWEKGKRTPWRITGDFVRQLAEKYAYKSGKWLIYSTR